jgi:hypothetical protein
MALTVRGMMPVVTRRRVEEPYGVESIVVSRTNALPADRARIEDAGSADGHAVPGREVAT